MSLKTETGSPLLTESGIDLISEDEEELNGQIRLIGCATLSLSALAILGLTTAFSIVPLQSRASLICLTSAAMNVEQKIAPVLLQARSTLSLQSRATVIVGKYKPLKSAPRLRLTAKIGAPTQPVVWVQPDSTLWFVVSSVPKAFLKITLQIDNAAPIEPEWKRENNGLPLILSIPAPDLGEGGVSRALIVRAWQHAESRLGAIAAPVTTLQYLLPNALKSALTPPAIATATLLRQFTPNWRDLTRIDWDWGNDPPGQAEITAHIRPENGKGRQLKNLTIGVADSAARSFFVEGIGMKILTTLQQPQPVYFGVARYQRGESGVKRLTKPVGIRAKYEGAQTANPNPDQMAGTAVDLSYVNWISAVAAKTGQNYSLVSQVLLAAKIKIKSIVANGGRVDFNDFGAFYAVWPQPAYRVDPLTSSVTITPPNRRPEFKASLGFENGVQNGTVLSDVEAS